MPRRTPTIALAALLCSTALAACGPRAQDETAASEGQAPAPAPATAAGTGAAVSADVVSPTPAMGDASVTVPEMAPTGGMAPAVDPNNPTERIPGKAPEMAPTGGERAPYSEPAR